VFSSADHKLRLTRHYPVLRPPLSANQKSYGHTLCFLMDLLSPQLPLAVFSRERIDEPFSWLACPFCCDAHKCQTARDVVRHASKADDFDEQKLIQIASVTQHSGPVDLERGPSGKRAFSSARRAEGRENPRPLRDGTLQSSAGAATRCGSMPRRGRRASGLARADRDCVPLAARARLRSARSCSCRARGFPRAAADLDSTCATTRDSSPGESSGSVN